jgi:hypothetical protein
VLTFSGSTSASGGTVLVSLYGWSTNPLVEYYVQEYSNNGVGTAQGSQVGTYSADDGTYTIWQHTQYNQPSIQGTSTFNQYISVRNSQRCGSGTITFANHVNAWKGFGMNLGTPNYQVIATEGWGGASGQSGYTLSIGCKFLVHSSCCFLAWLTNLCSIELVDSVINLVLVGLHAAIVVQHLVGTVLVGLRVRRLSQSPSFRMIKASCMRSSLVGSLDRISCKYCSQPNCI